jgi:hypothetical protein
MHVASNNFIVFVSTNKIAKCIRDIFFINSSITMSMPVI